MSQNSSDASKGKDEVTLREFILKIQEYSNELLKHWKLILFITIPIVALFLFRAMNAPVTYPTKLTFMVNEDEGGGFGGAMAILSQFGLGGGGGSGKFNLTKILELSKTGKIIHRAIFEKKTLGDNSNYLANHIIDIYDLHEKWEDSDSGLKGFKFTHDSIPAFNSVEKSALKAVRGIILGGSKKPGIYTTGLNEDTGIMSLKAATQTEELSIELLNSMYVHLSQFYIDQSIEKQLFTYNVVKEKVDSIDTALRTTEYQLANFKDSNRGLWTRTDALKETRMQRNVQILTVMYAESIKNLEIADFSLKTKTPFIQLIDAPMGPLVSVGKSKIMAIILGGILGCGIAFTFLIGRKVLRDLLEDA